MGLQQSVSYASRKGIPGMVKDINNCDIISAVCTTSVLPGTFVELALAADGETWLANVPSSATTTLAYGGVALYDPMQDPYAVPALGSISSISGTGFPVSAVINVVRRGSVFVNIDAATTAGSLGASMGATQANVQHPSSGVASATNTGGFFTAVASNTTAGIETTAAPGIYFERVVSAGLGLVQINMPRSA